MSYIVSVLTSGGKVAWCFIDILSCVETLKSIIFAKGNYSRIKMSMDHIAHLSSVGPFRIIIFRINMHFIPIFPIHLPGAMTYNKLAFVLCQKAFM
jgi:hypothetical protein